MDKSAGKNAAALEQRRVQMGDTGSQTDAMGDLLLAGGCPRFPGFTFDMSESGRGGAAAAAASATLPTIAVARPTPEKAAEDAAAAEAASVDEFAYDATVSVFAQT